MSALPPSVTDLAFSSSPPIKPTSRTDLKESSNGIDYQYAYNVLRRETMDGWRPIGSALASRENRVQGKNLYTNWSEFDLLRQVSVARTLDATNPIATGAVNKLVSFVLQTGGIYKIVPKSKSVKPPVGYVAAGQDATDQWLEETQWQFEEEEHVRTAIVDGELLVHKARDEDTQEATCRRFEPEQVVQPAGMTIMDGWRLGVQHKLNDVRKVLAYNVNWALGVPQNQQPMGGVVPASSVIHYKRNVVGSAARGVSDFFCNADDMDKIDRILDAIGAGTLAKSKIAYFRTHKEALPGTVDKFAEDNATSTFYDPLTQRQQKRFNPPDGSVADVPDTVGVTTVPQGTTLESIEAVNLLIRLTLAHRWSMPEFLANADSSNNNYASILVAGSPFVIFIRMNQAKFRAVWRDCIRWVLRVKIALKQLPADFFDYCDVQVTLPDPVISNALEDEQIREIRSRNHILSPQTWTSQVMLNYDDELANRREARANDPDTAMQGLPGVDQILGQVEPKADNA